MISATLLHDFTIRTHCSASRKKIYLLSSKTEFPFNLLGAFANQDHIIGQGSYGVVKALEIPEESGFTEIAVKEVLVDTRYLFDPRYAKPRGAEKLETEMHIGYEMGVAGFGPAVVACVVDDEGVYIAQQKLSFDLQSTDFAAFIIRPVGLYFRITVFGDIFIGIEALWALGYVHNDVKPANLMFYLDDEEIRLIDFGVCQLLADQNRGSGTPLYMSPDKLMYVELALESDLYAGALAVAVSLSNRKYVFSKKIWNKKKQKWVRRSLDDECFEGSKNPDLHSGHYKERRESPASPRIRRV